MTIYSRDAAGMLCKMHLIMRGMFFKCAIAAITANTAIVAARFGVVHGAAGCRSPHWKSSRSSRAV
jgi:hypothetical protein